MIQKIIVRLVLLVVFFITLIVIIAYSRGYRPSFSEKWIVPTGILVATSSPDGAKIYINSAFHGATNSNITLPPGHYDIEIRKDGYTTWKKNLSVKGELVTRADALLFPQNPSLSPLTSVGVTKSFYFEKSNKVVIFSEDGNIATPEATANGETGSIEKAGIYVLETSRRQVSIFSPLKLLAVKSIFPQSFDFTATTARLSPDEKQLLIKSANKAYLISTEEETKNPLEVTKSAPTIETAWAKLEETKVARILETFKEPLPKIASDSFAIVSFSPDESKILYRAKKNITLPTILTPPLVATNQTTEQRTLTAGDLYVYDKKEDKNYLIEENSKLETRNSKQIQNSKDKNSKQNNSQISNFKFQISNSILWFPDSAHLVIRKSSEIVVIDYDSTQQQTVYSGPFEMSFLGVTGEGNLVILANLNPQRNNLPDVYAVGIR